MNIKERLSFFQEMVQCEYPLHLWRYDPDFELIKTDCPAEMMLPDIISMLGFSSLILSHIENGKRLPLVLDTEFGLIWIAGFEYQGFRMFRFNPDRLKELAPEQFKTISAKLPPQDDMIKDIIYQERRFPLRTVQDIHGIYLVSSKELEESLIEGVRNLDAAAYELLDGICLFCSTQELRYLTDAELIETIYAQ